MGKHLFEYADYQAYNTEIREGIKKIDIWYAKRLIEFRKKLNAVIEDPELGAVFELDEELAAIKMARHGQLAGLVNRVYTRYRIEDERLIEESKRAEKQAED